MRSLRYWVTIAILSLMLLILLPLFPFTGAVAKVALGRETPAGFESALDYCLEVIHHEPSNEAAKSFCGPDVWDIKFVVTPRHHKTW
jgi:hypothetical protein